MCIRKSLGKIRLDDHNGPSDLNIYNDLAAHLLKMIP